MLEHLQGKWDVRPEGRRCCEALPGMGMFSLSWLLLLLSKPLASICSSGTAHFPRRMRTQSKELIHRRFSKNEHMLSFQEMINHFR